MTGTALLVVGLLGSVVALLLIVRRLRREVERYQTALVRSAEQLENIENSFQRFAPQHIVEQVARGGVLDEIKAEWRDVTVLFADLKGFTALSERIEPDEMVEMLNGYFSAMNEALMAHQGQLSRLMGDGLMAVFGATEEKNPWHTSDAVRAALAMREELATYNRGLGERRLPQLSFGVGIHTGRVVAGVVGTYLYMREFTVIGDPVNLASRVEGLTRIHDVDILVTSDVQKTLDARFVLRAMPPTIVKGKSEPVLTYAVEEFRASR
jgi:adenylate cyclase